MASATKATGRNAEAEVPAMKVLVADAAKIPDEAEVPCQPEV
jgi:hypothetical protein